MQPQRITFESHGASIVGHLFVPEGTGPFAALVFEGPLTSVKEQAPGHWAEAMARRGFVTLAFDHRHFGESGGEPRQLEDPVRKGQDVEAAISYLSSRDEVDASRVGVVGVCAGAGYLAPVVARDPRIRAFGTVAGFFHDAAMQRQWSGDGYEAALERARTARQTWEQTGVSETIPAVGQGDGEVAMPLQEAYEYYGTERGAHDNYTNAFAVMSREHTLPFDAQGHAGKIGVPTLMIHSEKALAPGLARSFFDKLGGPRQALWTESTGQIDFYDDPTRIEPNADQLAEHFRAHLG